LDSIRAILAELEASQILAELDAFQIFTLNEAKAAKYGAGSLSFYSIQFSPKDGTTSARTNTSKLFLFSNMQILIHNHLENTNIIIIKVPTDECFEPSLSSTRTKRVGML
jgi:hypothetical protein